MLRTLWIAALICAAFALAPTALAQDDPPPQAKPEEATRPAPADIVAAPDLPGVVVTGTPLNPPRLARALVVPEVPLRAVGSRDGRRCLR